MVAEQDDHPKHPKRNRFRSAAVALLLEGKQLAAFARDGEQAVVNVLAVIILVTTVLIRVPGADAKAWFSGAGDWANLAADLGIGYLAAWFFYYLVSWRTAYQARQRIAGIVIAQALQAERLAAQVVMIMRGSKTTGGQPPLTREECITLCNKLRWKDDSRQRNRMSTKPISVLGAFWDRLARMRSAMDPIVQMAPLFDVDVVATAASLRQCPLIDFLDPLHAMEDHVWEGLDLAVYEDDIWGYLRLSHRLWTLMTDRYPAARTALAASDIEASEGPVIA
jgi:hypothetical protein